MDPNYSKSIADSTKLIQPPNTTTESIFDNLTTKMIEVLLRAQTSSQLPIANSPTVLISIKDALWSQVVEMYISGKDKLGYINGNFPQPLETNPFFQIGRAHV